MFLIFQHMNLSFFDFHFLVLSDINLCFTSFSFEVDFALLHVVSLISPAGQGTKSAQPGAGMRTLSFSFCGIQP